MPLAIKKIFYFIKFLLGSPFFEPLKYVIKPYLPHKAFSCPTSISLKKCLHFFELCAVAKCKNCAESA